MARPRSILGLVFHLATLHVERRPGVCAVVLALVVALGAMLWPRHAARAPITATEGGLQGAVLLDGFAFAQPAPGSEGYRIVDVDQRGHARRERTLPATGELRVVGTQIGAAAAWQDGKRLRLARVEDDRDMGTWGRSVRQLCNGVASNATRFAVGWLEGDDTVWFVHGPLAAAAEGADEAGATRAEPVSIGARAFTRNDWCAVASAEDKIALMWRDADRLSLTMCSQKACSNLPVSFKLERRIPVLGVGCLRAACLLATPDDAGTTRVTMVTTTGRSKWTQTLEGASGAVSIVGVGDRAFAVGYATPSGARVDRFDRDGKAAPVWRDPASPRPPALAWASGRLLVAHYHGERAVGQTVELEP
jgi:hypothetical protein